MEKMIEIVKEKWLTPVSALPVFVVLGAACTLFVYYVDGLEEITLSPKQMLLVAGAFAVVWVIYLVACLLHSRLPKAADGTLAVLFCIEAESNELFKAAKFKLVEHFASLFAEGDGTKFKAFCVPKTQVAKYNLRDKSSALQLLEATNCVLLVSVRYTADDIENAENFELSIDYGVRHPTFNDSAQQVLSHDIASLQAPVGKQRFVKANTIEVFNSTSQTLVCIFQYLLGFVSLLAGENQKALDFLNSARLSVLMQHGALSGTTNIHDLIDDRLYVTLSQMSLACIHQFRTDKDTKHLRKMCDLLERANNLRSDTYFYNMNMAYAHIILDKNYEAAKLCIAKCKQSKQDLAWMYSDAFLCAYAGHAPGSVIAKYKKALATPYEELLELVEYIEYVLEHEVDRYTLHLAAALLYEELGDLKLMKYHLAVFVKYANGIDKRTQSFISTKIAKDCSSNCSGDCIACVDKASD